MLSPYSPIKTPTDEEIGWIGRPLLVHIAKPDQSLITRGYGPRGRGTPLRQMPLDQDPNDTRQLEATELEYRLPEAASRPAPVPQEAPAPSRIRKGQDEVRRFWNRQVVLTVGHEQCRDHFGEFIQRQETRKLSH